MKISVHSWHYRYMRKLGFSAPSNLCPYFWKLMFCLAVPVAALFAISFVLLVLIIAVIWVIHHLVAFGIGVAVVLVILAVLLGLAWLIFSSTSHRAFSAVGQVKVVNGLGEAVSLTGEYLVAVHHRLCPRLEFVDGPPVEQQLHVI